jgi:hypothetical protein
MNCIDLAIKAAGGKLTDKEIMDAFEQEGKIREAFIAAGKVDNLDARVARRITQLAMDKKIEAARMKRQIAQNIKARASIDAQLKDFAAAKMDPVRSIRALWEGTQREAEGGRASGYAQSLAYEAKWIGSAMSRIQAEKPHILKLFTNRDFDDAVTRELFELRKGGTPGKTGNTDAVYLARVLASHMEMARTDLNSLGAAIGKLDGYAGPQVHDDLKMASVSSAQWVDDILPLLDLGKSFPDAANEAEVRGILDNVFDTILTGVTNDITPLLKGQRTGPANLGTKLGKHRVLHFKDADTAIQYRDMYGRGSTIQGVFGMMGHQARMAGAMDKFGPNPKAMLLAVAAKVQKDLKKQIDGMEPGKARDTLVKQMNDLSSADGEIAKLKSTIDDVTGLASRPVKANVAAIGQGIRNVQALAKLGGAVITAMPSDTVTMASAAMFRNGSFFKGMMRSLGEIANRKDGKEIGFLLGEGFDGIIGHLAASVADGAPGVMSRTMQTFFKYSGLSGWTDTARAASARVIAAELGMNSTKAYGDLSPNLRYVLRLNGITEAKWEAIRSVGAKEVNGHTYITPDLVRNADDSMIEPIVATQIKEARAAILKPTKAGNITQAMTDKFDKKRAQIIDKARHDLELDLHRYYADETSYAVIETDAASRRIATAGYRPGTLAGETMRFVMQFKGFPIAFTQRVLGRSVLNAPSGRKAQAMHIGTTMAGLTVAGYMAMTAKDIARGQWPPRDPTSPKTLAAAAMQGGAIGIYGDFLFGEASRFGQGPLETLSGPGIGTLADLYNIFQKAKGGDVDAGKMLDVAVGNTPFINLFYLRPALDFLFLNSLREAARPGYMQRQEKRLRDERGQRYVLPRTLQEVIR